MNRQELFEGTMVGNPVQLDTTYLPFIKTRGNFCDVNLPRFFSGWPYYVIIFAALLMGSSKVLSQKTDAVNNRGTTENPTLRYARFPLAENIGSCELPLAGTVATCQPMFLPPWKENTAQKTAVSRF